MVDLLHNLPSTKWDDNQWIVWHGSVKKEFGKNDANDVFLEAFNARKGYSGITGSNANTSKLRGYMKKQGVEIGSDGLMSSPKDMFYSATGFMESAFGTGKTIFMVVGIVMFLLVVLFLFNVAKNPGQSVGTAAKYAA